MLSQTIEVAKVCRKAVVSQSLHDISHFGFRKMVDSLDVPTFWRHTTFGDGGILVGVNIQFEWSP